MSPDDALPVYGCPGCDAEFPSQAALDRHWEINHGNDALPTHETDPPPGGDEEF